MHLVEKSKIISMVNSLLVIVCSAYAFIVVPGFKELYEKLAISYPLFGEVVVNSYFYWPLILVAVLVFYVKFLMKTGISQTILRVIFSVNSLFLVFLLYALAVLVFSVHIPYAELEPLFQ